MGGESRLICQCKYANVFGGIHCEARGVIISVRAEGADMPTGKTKSRCAREAVNAPAIRGLPAMCRGCGNGDRNLRTGGADDK